MAWREAFVKTLQEKATKLRLDPELVQIMKSGCLRFLRNQPTLDPSTYPDARHQRLIQQQNEIGWRNFMRGRWTKKWAHQQHRFSQKQKQTKTSKTIGRNWVSIMIRTIWDSIYELWEQRNQDLHGSDLESYKEAQRQKMLRELRHAYGTKANQPPHCQPLFQVPLDEMEQLNNHRIQNWLSLWQPVLDQDDDSFTDGAVG